jgi:hypothetical protein
MALVGLWKKMLVLDATYGISWSWSSTNLVVLVQSWRKLTPDTYEGDLQYFSSKQHVHNS